MNHPNHRYLSASLLMLVFLGAMAPLTILASTLAVRPTLPSRAHGDRSTSPVSPAEIAKRAAAGQTMDNFRSSLDMKERVDFLLTPALLVQEALRNDTIITYPTE